MSEGRLTRRQAIKYGGVGAIAFTTPLVWTATVEKLCAAGMLPHVRVLGAIRIASNDFAAFVECLRRRFLPARSSLLHERRTSAGLPSAPVL